MKTISFVTISLVLIFSGCAKDNHIVTPSSSQTTSGSVSFTLDKTAIPQSVVLISSVLTRQGFDSLTGSVNLLQDTSAQISFDQVPVGSWHLRVDAKDINNTILYTGQTDVIVMESAITQVTLTLNPVLTGVGGIHIIVSWPLLSSWQDYAGNPVLSATDTTLQRRWIYAPQIIFDGGLYKMWFTAITNGTNIRSVSYAYSTDGIKWTLGSQSPVLLPGTASNWDYNHVLSGPVIKVDGVYKMYYGNASDFSDNWYTGLATSSDGIHWEKYSDPVLKPTGLEGSRLGSGSIIKIDSLFYLYYHTSIHGVGNAINLATSLDGINWTKYAGNPILKATESWEGTGIYHASVIYDGGVYKMTFMSDGSSVSGFGLAISTDGKTWIKDSKNPFFTSAMTVNGWGGYQVAYACFLKFGTEYRLYYSGYNQAKNDWMIGFATLK